MKSFVFVTILAMLAATSPARDDESAAPPPAPREPQAGRLALAGGGTMLFGLGWSCRQSSDTVGCEKSGPFAGPAIAARWRFSRAFSAGLAGAFAWRPSSWGTRSSDGSSSDFDQRLWTLSGEARVHPFQLGIVEPWLGAQAGVASARDTITYHGVPGRDRVAADQYAPAGSLGLGLDISFIPQLALELETRVMVAAFGDHPPALTALEVGSEMATSYGTLVAVGVGASLVVRP